MKNSIFRDVGLVLAFAAVAVLAVGIGVMTADQGVWYTLGMSVLYLVPKASLPPGWAVADLDVSPELKKALDDIFSKLKKRDEENAEKLKKVDEDIEKFGKVQEGTKDAIAKQNTDVANLHGQMKDIELKLARGEFNTTPPDKKTPGELIILDKSFESWAKGAQGEGAGGAAGKFRYNLKTITSLSSSGGAGIYSDQLPGVIENPLRPLSIRDLLMPGRTTSSLLEWIQELLYTNNADVVSEGTLKPESNITYQRKNTGVSTIAHWIRATKQVLADFPQLASLINGRLRWGLKIKEEDQILYGDGVEENLLGLVPQATAYNTGLNSDDDTMIDVVRHAMLQVRLAFYPSSGTVMSPTDWHYVELTKDNENRYIMASPTSRTPPMLWGQPVVESDGMHSGNFLVGAFRMAAQLFDREEAAILVSTEDQDNFVKNLVTILCEERLALLVYRPSAFVYGNFPGGSTT